MVANDLDPRDRWLGLRCMRSAIDPIPYAMKDKENKRVPMRGRAQAAAEFLAEKIWGETQAGTTPSSSSQTLPKVVRTHLNMRQDEFKIEELIRIIRKLKRRKTPGPDEVPIEFFKEMQAPALRDMLE